MEKIWATPAVKKSSKTCENSVIVDGGRLIFFVTDFFLRGGYWFFFVTDKNYQLQKNSFVTDSCEKNDILSIN